jgi:hypothetical protein
VVDSGPAATYALTGNVVDDSAVAMAGVTITLTGDASDSDTTDASGDYSFPALEDGTYTITPTLTGFTFVPSSDEVVISGGADTSDAVGTFTPIASDFEGGTIGQLITTGTDWVKGGLTADSDTPYVRAQPSDLFFDFSAYTKCAEVDPDSSTHQAALDLGITLPLSFRAEFGVYGLDEGYFFCQLADVNDLYANLGDMIRTNARSDSSLLTNLSFVDGATVDNDAGTTQTGQDFDRPTKVRMQYTDATRTLLCTAIKYDGATWTNSTVIDASVDMTTLRWAHFYGGVDSAFWGTASLVYFWAGSLAADWPTRTIAAV